jgi:hypothetical protein
MLLFHGTDLESARRLLGGEPLDSVKAAPLKIDGPPGFFMAFEVADAEFFALRQRRGAATVVSIEISSRAMAELIAHGADRRAIPRGLRSPRFAGDELYVPTAAFDKFNELRGSGEIAMLA